MNEPGWLERIDDGYRIAKIDPAEAGELDASISRHPAGAAQQPVVSLLIHGLLDNLGQTVIDLTDAVADIAETNKRDLATWLLRLKRLLMEVDGAKRKVEATLAAAMTDKIEEIPGIGILELYSGARRKWTDSAACLSKVISVASEQRFDPDTGEVLDSVEDAIEAALAAALPATVSWRVGGLKALGIDPNRYSDWEEGRPTVSIKVAE